MGEDGDRVTWLGHAGTAIDLAGVRLLTDPVLRARVGPLRRRGGAPEPATWAAPDAVLVSHLHHDHLDLPSLRRLGRDVPLVVPAGAAPLLRGFGDVREVRPGDTVAVGGVEVTALPARHPGGRTGRRLRAHALGYLVRGGGRTVWFAGDTGRHDAQRDLASGAGGIDLALLPVGGWGPTLGPGHLDPDAAADVAALVGARTAVPIHWGTLLLPGLPTLRPDLLRAGERFRAAAAQRAAGTRVAVLRVGRYERIP